MRMRYANRIDALSQMIDLRRLQAGQAPEASRPCRRQTKGDSAEARILEIAEVAYVLQGDGFPEPEILKRIGQVYETAPPPPNHSYDPLRDYLGNHLRTYDPEYLELGSDLFHAALALASLWAEIHAARLAASSWPPSEMLGEPWAIEGYAGIVREGHNVPDSAWPTFGRSLADLDVLLDEYRGGGAAAGVRRMKARAIPGDKLHGYSTSPMSWAAMMGSSGIALVRNGRSIDFFETMMN
jgi:hypothetical protein